jgi:hypothetical protein
MKNFNTALLILLMVFLLNGCGDSDDSKVDSINGSSNAGTTQPSGQGTTQPTNINSYPNVAGHGILCKPVSDSNRNLAILLARSYGRPAVKVLDMQKNVIENGRFVYYSNPNRATYRFGRPGRSFPSPCLVQVGSKIYKVDNPAKRYE